MYTFLKPFYKFFKKLFPIILYINRIFHINFFKYTEKNRKKHTNFKYTEKNYKNESKNFNNLKKIGKNIYKI